MSTSNYDKSSGDRKYDAKYALDSSDGVRMLLRDYHALIERQYKGDYDSVVILADLAAAIEKAGLTDRQRTSFRLIYAEGLTQVATADELGVSKQTVNRLVSVGEAKIARVYENWARRGEGYTLTTNGDGADNG